MRKRKSLILLLLAVCLLLSGCDIAWFSSTINELKGSLIGNSYTIGTYDNYGNKTLETSGKKISITGNKIETITRFIFVRSIPMARPALHARMRNTMQISATKATIPPQIAYIAGLFSCDKIDMANFPFLFLLRPV